jgi:hypothetical protein
MGRWRRNFDVGGGEGRGSVCLCWRGGDTAVWNAHFQKDECVKVCKNAYEILKILKMKDEEEHKRQG